MKKDRVSKTVVFDSINSIKIIEETGKGVNDIKPGDRITTIAYGGSLSEHFIADRKTIVKIPDDVKNFEFWISEPVAT